MADDHACRSEVARLREAWALPGYRDGTIADWARDVGKSGRLNRVPVFLRDLAAALDRDQAVDLYCRLRELSERSELEWREEFEEAFPQTAGHLPEIDRDHYLYVVAAGLAMAFLRDSEPEVIRVLARAQRFGLDVAMLRVAVGGERTGGVAPESEWSEAPPAAGEFELVTVAEFARRLGFLRAADLAAGGPAEPLYGL
jgi:hypothetical protein